MDQEMVGPGILTLRVKWKDPDISVNFQRRFEHITISTFLFVENIGVVINVQSEV